MARVTWIDGDSGDTVQGVIDDNFIEVYQLRDEVTVATDVIGFTIKKQVRTEYNEHKPFFTICFDDNQQSVHTGWRPFFANKGIVGCLPIAIFHVGETELVPPYMTWEEIHDMEDDGWEIMGHSMTHQAFQTLGEEEARYELSECKRILIEQGFNPINFAWPLSENVGDENRRICREYYRSSRGYYSPVENKSPLNEHSFNPFDIKSAGERVDITTQDGMDWILGLVDQAYDENRWLIWTGHAWTANFETALEEVIDYVQAKGIEILTINEVLNRKWNYIEAGSQFSVGEEAVRIGLADGDSLVCQDRRTGVGRYAGEGNRELGNTHVGYFAGRFSEGMGMVSLGEYAAYQSGHQYSVNVGFKAGMQAAPVNSYYMVNVGNQAGEDAYGNATINIGVNAGNGGSAENCIHIGNKAGYENTIDGNFEVKQNGENVLALLKGNFGTQDFIHGCPDGAAVDGDLENSMAHFYLDESGDTLNVKVKYSDGTVKTGVVANLT